MRERFSNQFTNFPLAELHAHLWRQFKFLLDEKIMTEEELAYCNKVAFSSTFVPSGGLSAYL